MKGFTQQVEGARPLCQVHVAGRVINYRRLGAGARPAILLSSEPPEGDMWPSALSLLVLRYRLSAPVMQQGFESDFTALLRGFLDGVGAEAVTLVATGAWCGPALDFAAADQERVERLILIPRDTQYAAPIGEAMGQTTLFGLVIPRDRAEPAALEALSRFIDEPLRHA